MLRSGPTQPRLDMSSITKGQILQGLVFFVAGCVFIYNWPEHSFIDEYSGDQPTPKVEVENISKLFSDRYVRNCVTQNTIGKIPGDILTEYYKPLAELSETHEQRKSGFQKVFDKREWGRGDRHDPHQLIASGAGSTLDYSQEVMATLNTIITLIKKELGLTRVKMFDIPCGDMAWMSRFLKSRGDVDYTGWDIVPDLITHHNKKYANYPWKFYVRDIVVDHLNESYHLILSRHLMQHLFTKDAMLAMDKFSVSGSKFVLMTTYSKHPHNDELKIKPGRMTPLNLEIPPINLVPPLCISRDGPPEKSAMSIGLWSLPLKQVRRCEKAGAFEINGQTFHSCVDWSAR